MAGADSRIAGMTCSSCAQNIERALLQPPQLAHERDAAPYRGQMLAEASGVKIS